MSPPCRLGNGSTTGSDSPVDVFGIGNAVLVVAGSRHTCTLLADASVSCWGGQGNARGTSANDIALVPVRVTMTGAVNALALGDSHTCVSVTSGGVQCLGSGASMRLGTGGQSSELNPNPSPYLESSVTSLSVMGLP